MANRLIVDVTQLVHWPGKLTGIPRVMNELVTRFALRDSVLFVVWDTKERTMFQIDIAQTLSRRGELIAYINESQDESVRNTEAKQLQIRRATPARVAAGLLRRLDERGVKSAGRLQSKLSSRQKRHYREVDVSRGDTLFVLWGEQQDQNYIEKLLSYKQRGAKLVQISYDILPLIAPQYSGHSTNSMLHYTKAIFPVADIVLSISQNTKRDIEKWLNEQTLPIPRIEVFRLGDDFQRTKQRKPDDETFASSGLKGDDFILCVGTIEARKNHTILYYAYKLAAQNGVTLPKIVVVGRRGWMTENIYELITSDPETKEKFVILESVGDNELAWLYKKALFSIYPSFYEGWGLPIAESIAHSTPCISSNTSSMPEIAGDLIDYFSPVASNECLAAIEKLLAPIELKNAKQRIKKYEPTSWDETFKQVDEYIRSTK